MMKNVDNTVGNLGGESCETLLLVLNNFVNHFFPCENPNRLHGFQRGQARFSNRVWLDGAGLATGIQGIYNWNSIFVVNLFSESHRKTDVCVMSIIFQ